MLGISYRVTESFFKISFEDFHNFHEIYPNGGHELAFFTTMTERILRIS